MNNVRPWLRCSDLPGRESDPKDVMEERKLKRRIGGWRLTDQKEDEERQSRQKKKHMQGFVS